MRPFHNSKKGIPLNLFTKIENENHIEDVIPKNNYNPFEEDKPNNIENNQIHRLKFEIKNEEKRDVEIFENNILNQMIENEELINK